MTEPDLLELVRRAAGRDEVAATELVRRFQPELRRIVRFQLTDPGLRRFLDSLDVCQSVFAAFFAQLQAGELRFEHTQQLAGLLGLMARHKVIDLGRRHRAVRRGGGPPADLPDGLADLVADLAPPPDEALADRDLVRGVRARLPAADQEVLDLWLDGHGWVDIAAAVGGRPDALRKRLGRAVDAAAVELGLLERPHD